MQDTMDRFANACKCFGLTISLDKTKVMFTPVPGEEYVEPDIYVYGTRLKVVKSFVYLGSTLASDGSLDVEIIVQINRALVAFGNLEDKVWSDRNITINTKFAAYETCVLNFFYMPLRRGPCINIKVRLSKGFTNIALGISWASNGSI